MVGHVLRQRKRRTHDRRLEREIYVEPRVGHRTSDVRRGLALSVMVDLATGTPVSCCAPKRVHADPATKPSPVTTGR
jgi:hypothetical protein